LINFFNVSKASMLNLPCEVVQKVGKEWEKSDWLISRYLGKPKQLERILKKLIFRRSPNMLMRKWRRF
jgi:hypothetical protein